MAASSSGNNFTSPPTSYSNNDTKPFEFSDLDTPPRIPITADQYKLCCEALASFKDKQQNKPHQITQEFAHLQANRIRASEMARTCTVALDGVNLSKNRYTDILPCKFCNLFSF